MDFPELFLTVNIYGILISMNSKLSLPKSIETRSLFPKRLLAISAVVSLALWVAWVVTMPGLGLTMATKPLYFPEAPIWHIGLYLGNLATMGYSVLGIGCRWLDRNVESKQTQPPKRLKP